MNFRKHNEARRIDPPEQMDSAVVRAAQAILQGEDGIERVHIENRLQQLIDLAASLTEEVPKGTEAAARVHMSWLSAQDALEAWESNA